jgi:sortase A
MMRIRRALLPLALTLVACMLLTAGWVAYQVTDPGAGQRQHAVQDRLQHQWRAATQTAHRAGPGGTGAAGAQNPDHLRLATGQPFAFIRVPAFGAGWKFAIVEGTGLSQLALGPGHVPGTGLPGQPGNFVVAAHDVTAGNPFMHLGSLRHPDRVFIYTRTHTYEYAVHAKRVVRYTDVKVEDPVPGRSPGDAPRATITLITCTPVTLAFTPWRIVVTGELIRTEARA